LTAIDSYGNFTVTGLDFDIVRDLAGEDAMSDDGKDGHWCFAWYEGEGLPPNSKTRAALVDKHRWPAGSTVRIGFLDGTAAQKALVKKYAVGWIAPGRANLKFSWVPAAQADIRISFAAKGSWSVIGTTCKTVPKPRATMNFGWLTPTVTEKEAERVILHEFGHALGLIHEHQSPLGTINWNKPAVYADLAGPPNNWSTATIDHNMFEAYPQQEIEGTTLDPKSIMMYPLPASWVKPPTQPVGLNAILSVKDKSFIKKAYP
jgi:serralysin